MDKCDILICGGGPAGSSCAWKLRRSGLDVAVMDKATFPRDKVCAGWITPQVVEDLEIDIHDYRRDRTFQPITGFRTGMIGGREVETRYDRPVSYGIRRFEFDNYLLNHCGARLRLNEGVKSLERGPEATDMRGTNYSVNASVHIGSLVDFLISTGKTTDGSAFGPVKFTATIKTAR